MQRMFEGLTVLVCASFIAAPAAATILADFGAEVIKIEPPTGDPFRHLPRLPGNPKCEDREWPVLLECLGREELAAGPRFPTTPHPHARAPPPTAAFVEG